MLLFHGSSRIIEKPMYGGGKAYNDYGRGFYCTESLDMASEWAVNLNRDGVVNRYELDMNSLKILNLNSDKYTILNWLAILLNNREFDIRTDFADEAKKYILSRFLINYEDYDIIRGYRADDRYFAYAQDFLNNTISVRTLSRAMLLGGMGEQIVLKSSKAFGMIEYKGYTDAINSDWYSLKARRDLSARQQYNMMRREPWRRGETYILQIIDEEISDEDERIRFKPSV